MIEKEFEKEQSQKKYSLELKLGNLTLQIKDVTLTKRQIKNYKKYFNIDARNLNEQLDEK